jgi:hypothetical protein
MVDTSYPDVPVYNSYKKDSDNEYLDGSKHCYILKFNKEYLPPSSVFWSVTMYKLPEQLLVNNPLKRYLINSPMFSSLEKDPDGGLTIYMQKNSPGPGKECNWLPAPNAPFFIVLRLYWPIGEKGNELHEPLVIKQA